MEMFQKFLIVLVVATIGLVSVSEALPRTCAEAGFCCSGNNLTCYAFGPTLNSQDAEKCFCDEECRTYGDCCSDIQGTCENKLRVDCKTGAWHTLQKCSRKCGRGFQIFKRKVIQHARHGGEHCGPLRQKRTCIGTDCISQDVNFQKREMEEIGKIIPAKYGIYRKSKKYSPLHDIRKNLFASNEIPRRPVYCAYFEIEKAHKACNTSSPLFAWASIMTEGTQVCVECQPFVMHKELGVRCKGHGVYQNTTHWNAIGVPHCRGKWRMLTKHEPCTCNLAGEKDFIFL